MFKQSVTGSYSEQVEISVPPHIIFLKYYPTVCEYDSQVIFSLCATCSVQLIVFEMVILKTVFTMLSVRGHFDMP